MIKSALARQIAADIATQIDAGHFAPGAHLSTEILAKRFLVSRSPVREALGYLTEKGLVEKKQNRGCFVADTIPLVANDLNATFQRPVLDEVYFRFADDWLMDKIEAEVTELFVRARYALTKAQTQDLLSRAAKDGWAEPKRGYGWKLKAVAKTPAAYNEIYRFRAVIEPAAILEPSFRFDRNVAARLRREQERLAAGEFNWLGPDMMIGAGVSFHEALVAMSGNLMFLQALERANQLRKIVEYRLRIKPERVILQSQEHLVILNYLEKGENLDAAHAMKQHLLGALAIKSAIVYSDM